MASIEQKNMVDTHKDASANPKHSNKSEMNIDAIKVIKLLEKLNFRADDYSEQNYERVDAERTGKGYYTVNLLSRDRKTGILLVDAKDGQSSLKLYYGVVIGDRVFPLYQVTEIKHRQHESRKLDNLADTLRKEIGVAERMFGIVANELKRTLMNDSDTAELSAECFAVRRNHPNYRNTPDKLLLSRPGTMSAFNGLLTMLATYADIKWPRHFLTLSQRISEKVLEVTI